MSPDGLKVYVTNFNVGGTGTVSVIDTVTNTLTDTISVGDGPDWVEFSPDGTLAYVANAGDGTAAGTVSVINTATNSVIGSPITVGVNPVQLSVSGDGNTLYVANYTGATTAAGTVSVIDTNPDNIGTYNTVIDTFNITYGPGAVQTLYGQN